MNLQNLLFRSAKICPEQACLLHGTQQVLTYRQLAKRSASLASQFDLWGLQPQQRILLYMTNNINYLEILYAAWWAGLVVVPVNAKLHPKELRFIIEDAAPACLFVSSDLDHALNEQLSSQIDQNMRVIISGSPEYEKLMQHSEREIFSNRPDDLAWLFYTSGTTGNPKGVMQTHRNLLAMTACYFTDVDTVRPQDSIVYAAPMSHGAGLYNFAHVAKAAKHIVPESGGFDPAELCLLAEKVGDLSMFAAPTMVKRLVKHIEENNLSADGFKTIVYGGGPMYLEDIQHSLKVMGNRLVQIYGQGESPMTITALGREHLLDQAHPRWIERISSVGTAQLLVDVRIADELGNFLPVDEIGEIVVRGDAVMLGYWNSPAATDKALQNGWLRTGDVGSFDSDGFLTLKDRSKDVIISGGSNIYPREVEEVLLMHPRVSEVSVIGRADAEWGEVVIACVVGQNVAFHELDQLCIENIARFKRPKEYLFFPSLPKNNYGKILKTKLREQIKQQIDCPPKPQY